MADKPKKWIKSAIKHPGALRKEAKAAGESTREFAEAHKHDSGTTGNRSRMALTLMGMHHGKDRRKRLYNRSKHED